MKVIEDIKNLIGGFLLNREVESQKAAHRLIPFARVQHIGIVYNAGNRDDEAMVTNYANQLRSEGKKVFMMGYVDMKQLPHTKKFNLQSEFFWKEKLNGFNLPIRGKIGRFLELDFDLLLNLYTEPLLPLRAISVYSSAHYRVGCLLDNKTGYCDAFIDTGEQKKLDFLIQQIDFYLKAIK